jgi:hypothetical protein
MFSYDFACMASNGDVALKFGASAEAEVVGSTGKARDTSGEVAEDGILPGKSTKISGPVQICLIGLLTTESFCCGATLPRSRWSG